MEVHGKKKKEKREIYNDVEEKKVFWFVFLDHLTWWVARWHVWSLTKREK